MDLTQALHARRMARQPSPVDPALDRNVRGRLEL